MKDFEKLDLAFFGAKSRAMAICEKIAGNPDDVDGETMLSLYAAMVTYKELYDEVAASMRVK